MKYENNKLFYWTSIKQILEWYDYNIDYGMMIKWWMELNNDWL